MEKKRKLIFKVSESIEATIHQRAIELVKEGKTEGIVDSKHLG